MDEYELRPSPGVESFLDRIAAGPEYLAFNLFFSSLLTCPGSSGRREFAHHGPRRTLHFSYYVSEKLKVVFLLMAYQERPGEPKERDFLMETELLEAIQALEAEDDEDPEAKTP